MEEVFTNIYEGKVWGDNGETEYTGTSGSGSAVDYNKDYIPYLKDVIKTNKFKTVVDLGCGDFRCGPLIYDDLEVEYTGYDVYKKVIDYNKKRHPRYTFHHLDFYNKKEQIVRADMCILKDVLHHWSAEDIYTFLDYLVDNKCFKIIFIVNCCQQVDDTNINRGDFRPLNSKLFPLKKYNPLRVFTYETKEVCII